MSIRKGDKVKVIAGKDKGKEGKVLRVHPVQGARHRRARQHDQEGQRPTQKNPKGGILEIEAPIHVSQRDAGVPELLAAHPRRPQRGDGARVRVCKKCGNDIDK